MKITICTDSNGETVVSLPHRDEERVVPNLGVVTSCVRAGVIEEKSGLFSVQFMQEALHCFNKAGFSSRDAAVAYEQSVLAQDENLCLALG